MPTISAMVTHMEKQVGRLLDTIDKLEIREKTSSFFPVTTAQGKIAEVQPPPSGDGSYS